MLTKRAEGRRDIRRMISHFPIGPASYEFLLLPSRGHGGTGITVMDSSFAKLDSRP
jgi:hypothetical protein